MAREEADVTPIQESTWQVLRKGVLEEVGLPNGNVRFRVRIADAGREAFITQWFNDIAPAADFLNNVKEENEAWVKATKKK